MTTLILITFSTKGYFLFTCSLERTIDDINKSIHGVSLLVISTQLFHGIILRSLDQCINL